MSEPIQTPEAVTAPETPATPLEAPKKFPTLWIVLWALLVVAFSIYSFFAGTYNTLVTKEEGVKTAWANVESQYQRRLDLIDNLVGIVKWSANFEKATLEAVVKARASATNTKIDVNNVDEVAKFQEQQNGLSQALSRLISITENYPELKASQQFGDLMVEVAGTENRIATERGRYNESVQDFNTFVRIFPKNIIASLFGFQQKTRFEASEDAKNAPKVDFGDFKDK